MEGLIIMISFVALIKYSPLGKQLDKMEVGGIRKIIYSEYNFNNNSKQNNSNGGVRFITFQKNKFIFGVEQNYSSTNYVCGNNFNTFNYLNYYDNLNYLCKSNLDFKDNGLRLGYFFPIENTKFSISSFFSFGEGKVKSNFIFTDKVTYNYDYFGFSSSLNYDFKLGFSNSKNNDFGFDMRLYLELGYRRNILSDTYFQKQLHAFMNDYTFGVGGSFRFDFKSDSKENNYEFK